MCLVSPRAYHFLTCQWLFEGTHQQKKYTYYASSYGKRVGHRRKNRHSYRREMFSNGLVDGFTGESDHDFRLDSLGPSSCLSYLHGSCSFNHPSMYCIFIT